MRTAIALLALATAFGQDTATYQSSSVDVNGAAIPGPLVTTSKSKTGSSRTETMQSINGRMVPREQITERVIRDGPIRVVERTLQRFDPGGRPTPPEIIVMEQENRPDGSTLLRSTTSRRDINGNLQVTERSVTETRKAGGSENSETVIERPTFNGALEPVEKRSATKTGSADAFQQTTTSYRRGPDGFYEAAREITQRQKGSSSTTDQTEQYGIGATGNMELQSQTTRRILKNTDGSETETVDLFSKFVPGVVGESNGRLKLQERDTIEKLPAADGSLRETLQVQRPTLADPTVLSRPRTVSETICKGKCNE